MAIIKLTKTDSYWSDFEQDVKELEDEPIWINTSKLNFFQNGYICIGKEKIKVRESPEEIISLIKEAENGKRIDY